MDAPRSRAPFVATLLLVALILAAGGVTALLGRARLQPVGHAEATLTSLGAHPLVPGAHVYLLRVMGVTRDHDVLDMGRAFVVSTRRDGVWSDVAGVTSHVPVYDTSLRRLDKKIETIVELDRWGNEVEGWRSASLHVQGWRAPPGLHCVTWETGLVVGDAPPDMVRVHGILEDDQQKPRPFDVYVAVPPKR